MKAPCDVLMLTPTLGLGGAERLRSVVARELHRRGIAVYVTAIRGGGPFEAELRAAGVSVDVLDLPGGLFNLRTHRTLRRHIRTLRPRVIQSGQFVTNALAVAAAGQTPCVIEEHGFSVWKKRRHHLVDRRWTGPRCVAAIACSDAVARAAEASLNLPVGGVTTIHNCVEISDAAGDPLPESNGPVVVTVGTLRPAKAHRVLIDAWSRLHAAGDLPTAAELWVVGDGPLRDPLEQSVPAGVNVRFLGSRTDVGRILQRADMFAFPSTDEGFGIALAEAMASGLPCVASDAGGIPELVGDGVTGLLFPPGDVNRLAEALRCLLHDRALASRLGEAAREDATRRFTPAAYVDRLLEIYRSVGVAVPALPAAKTVRDEMLAATSTGAVR